MQHAAWLCQAIHASGVSTVGPSGACAPPTELTFLSCSCCTRLCTEHLHILGPTNLSSLDTPLIHAGGNIGKKLMILSRTTLRIYSRLYVTLATLQANPFTSNSVSLSSIWKAWNNYMVVLSNHTRQLAIGTLRVSLGTMHVASFFIVHYPTRDLQGRLAL